MADGQDLAGGPEQGDPAITVFDYDVVGGTTQDMNKLGAALYYLQFGSDTARQMLDAARGLTIEFWNTIGGQAGFGSQNSPTIQWNPDVALGLGSGGWASAASVLIAEFAHLVAPDGLSNAAGSRYWDGSKGEEAAHDLANVVLGELGEPLRHGYADAFLFETTDPTGFSHWGFGDMNRIADLFQVGDTNGFIGPMDFNGTLRGQLMGSDFGQAIPPVFDSSWLDSGDWFSGYDTIMLKTG